MNETVTTKYGQPGFVETTESFDYMQRYVSIPLSDDSYASVAPFTNMS